MQLIHISKAKAHNGHEYCNNPKEIVNLAEKLGFSHEKTAEMAEADISTIDNWKRTNEASVEYVNRLVEKLITYINSSD